MVAIGFRRHQRPPQLDPSYSIFRKVVFEGLARRNKSGAAPPTVLGDGWHAVMARRAAQQHARVGGRVGQTGGRPPGRLARRRPGIGRAHRTPTRCQDACGSGRVLEGERLLMY
jgi:hypothetical protein